MTGCYKKAHYGAHWLVGVCNCYCVIAHIREVGPGLGVAPAYRLIVNVGEKPLGFSAANLLGPGGSMFGSCFRCRIPVVSRSIVKAAVAAGPMWKVGKGLIEESQVVLNSSGLNSRTSIS